MFVSCFRRSTLPSILFFLSLPFLSLTIPEAHATSINNNDNDSPTPVQNVASPGLQSATPSPAPSIEAPLSSIAAHRDSNSSSPTPLPSYHQEQQQQEQLNENQQLRQEQQQQQAQHGKHERDEQHIHYAQQKRQQTKQQEQEQEQNQQYQQHQQEQPHLDQIQIQQQQQQQQPSSPQPSPLSAHPSHTAHPHHRLTPSPQIDPMFIPLSEWKRLKLQDIEARARATVPPAPSHRDSDHSSSLPPSNPPPCPAPSQGRRRRRRSRCTRVCRLRNRTLHTFFARPRSRTLSKKRLPSTPSASSPPSSQDVPPLTSLPSMAQKPNETPTSPSTAAAAANVAAADAAATATATSTTMALSSEPSSSPVSHDSATVITETNNAVTAIISSADPSSTSAMPTATSDAALITATTSTAATITHALLKSNSIQRFAPHYHRHKQFHPNYERQHTYDANASNLPGVPQPSLNPIRLLPSTSINRGLPATLPPNELPTPMCSLRPSALPHPVTLGSPVVAAALARLPDVRPFAVVAMRIVPPALLPLPLHLQLQLPQVLQLPSFPSFSSRFSSPTEFMNFMKVKWLPFLQKWFVQFTEAVYDLQCVIATRSVALPNPATPARELFRNASAALAGMPAALPLLSPYARYRAERSRRRRLSAILSTPASVSTSSNPGDARGCIQGEGKNKHNIGNTGSGEAGVKEKPFNFASADAGARVLASSGGTMGAKNVIVDSLDKYLLTPCAGEGVGGSRWLDLELSEEIILESVQIANVEFYSSSPRRVAVLGAAAYPPSRWNLLGVFEFSDVHGIQRFAVNRRIVTRYLRVMFAGKHGSEHYCPITVVRVFGKNLIADLKDKFNRPSSSSSTDGTKGYGGSDSTHSGKRAKPTSRPDISGTGYNTKGSGATHTSSAHQEIPTTDDTNKPDERLKGAITNSVSDGDKNQGTHNQEKVPVLQQGGKNHEPPYPYEATNQQNHAKESSTDKNQGLTEMLTGVKQDSEPDAAGKTDGMSDVTGAKGTAKDIDDHASYGRGGSSTDKEEGIPQVNTANEAHVRHHGGDGEGLSEDDRLVLEAVRSEELLHASGEDNIFLKVTRILRLLELNQTLTNQYIDSQLGRFARALSGVHDRGEAARKECDNSARSAAVRLENLQARVEELGVAIWWRDVVLVVAVLSLGAVVGAHCIMWTAMSGAGMHATAELVVGATGGSGSGESGEGLGGDKASANTRIAASSNVDGSVRDEVVISSGGGRRTRRRKKAGKAQDGQGLCREERSVSSVELSTRRSSVGTGTSMTGVSAAAIDDLFKE